MSMLGRPPKSFAKLNRNFCNFPIARDRRNHTWRYRKGKKTGQWFGGDDRIRFSLPPNVDPEQRQFPTAFDVNVMLAILDEVERRDSCEIEFKSYSALLKATGYTTEERNRTKVKGSLTFWKLLTIRFGQWYFHKSTKDGSERKRGKKQLPPLIAAVKLVSRRVRIRIAPEWREIAKGYYERVPYPLPREAAAQNLVLVLLTSYSWLVTKDLQGVEVVKGGYPRKVQSSAVQSD